MGFSIGDTPHEPQEDLSGLYNGRLVKFEIVDKPDWRIEAEIARYGKEPDKVDTKQLAWTFRFEDESWSGPEEMNAYTSRTWGSKSRATEFAQSLLGGPILPGTDSEVLVDRPCRISISYSDKGNNYIESVKPPKKSALSPVQGQQTASPNERLTASYDGSPEVDDAYWEQLALEASQIVERDANRT